MLPFVFTHPFPVRTTSLVATTLLLTGIVVFLFMFLPVAVFGMRPDTWWDYFCNFWNLTWL